jgi:hypothetical protein
MIRKIKPAMRQQRCAPRRNGRMGTLVRHGKRRRRRFELVSVRARHQSVVDD